MRPTEKIETQIALHTLLQEHQIPNAEVVEKGFDTELNSGFVIQKAITGQELLAYQEDKVLLGNLLERSGPILHKIHGIELPKFGQLKVTNGMLEGNFETWREYLETVRPNTDYLVEHEFITINEERHFNQIFDQLLEREIEQGSLLHNDFHPVHIFSDGEEITGVIDWDRALIGDPCYDLAVTRVCLNMEMHDRVEQGYSYEIDFEAVNTYVLWVLLTKIIWRHKNNLPTVKQGLEQLDKFRSTIYRN